MTIAALLLFHLRPMMLSAKRLHDIDGCNFSKQKVTAVDRRLHCLGNTGLKGRTAEELSQIFCCRDSNADQHALQWALTPKLPTALGGHQGGVPTFGQTRMRWMLEGARSILYPRVPFQSDRWDPFLERQIKYEVKEHTQTEICSSTTRHSHWHIECRSGVCTCG